MLLVLVWEHAWSFDLSVVPTVDRCSFTIYNSLVRKTSSLCVCSWWPTDSVSIKANWVCFLTDFAAWITCRTLWNCHPLFVLNLNIMYACCCRIILYVQMVQLHHLKTVHLMYIQVSKSSQDWGDNINSRKYLQTLSQS